MSERIFSQVQKYRKRFGTRDPFELLDAMGIVLIKSNAYPHDGLRGYCTIMNQTRYVVINQKQPEEEQRVVTGHEAGHLIIHPEELKMGAFQDWDVYNAKGLLEREANLFSADYLLDDGEVLDLMHSKDADFFRVAQELRIPTPFFAFKLYSMVARGYNMRMPVELNSTFLK